MWPLLALHISLGRSHFITDVNDRKEDHEIDSFKGYQITRNFSLDNIAFRSF